MVISLLCGTLSESVCGPLTPNPPFLTQFPLRAEVRSAPGHSEARGPSRGHQ